MPFSSDEDLITRISVVAGRICGCQKSSRMWPRERSESLTVLSDKCEGISPFPEQKDIFFFEENSTGLHFSIIRNHKKRMRNKPGNTELRSRGAGDGRFYLKDGKGLSFCFKSFQYS
ncbi:hypothetical protein TNCV_2358781 [Trichonephila clavipes]|nr:hypothetical protein TNCV_2358781 [Trichonephila clavipes]